METFGAGNYRSWIDWKFSKCPLGWSMQRLIVCCFCLLQKSNMSRIIWVQQAILGIWLPVYPFQINDDRCMPLVYRLSPQLWARVVNWKRRKRKLSLGQSLLEMKKKAKWKTLMFRLSPSSWQRRCKHFRGAGLLVVGGAVSLGAGSRGGSCTVHGGSWKDLKGQPCWTLMSPLRGQNGASAEGKKLPCHSQCHSFLYMGLEYTESSSTQALFVFSLKMRVT